MAHKGYKQTPEHIAKRAMWGDKNPKWLGNAVSVRGGRARALRLYPSIGPCSICGKKKAERHHKDGNTANNKPDNIVVLCRRCHMETDARLAQARANMLRIQADGALASASRHVDTKYKIGDPCALCGRPLTTTSTNRRFAYIGCNKFRGGCGWNAGSRRK